jgi:hypothetical protein
MTPITSREEEAFLAAVKEASDAVQQGDNPNEALARVARDHRFTPGQLKIAVVAVNTGRQLGQWENGSSLLDKLASFPLADYNMIAGQVWTDTSEKTAAEHTWDYHAGPSWFKGRFDPDAPARMVKTAKLNANSDKSPPQKQASFDMLERQMEEHRREASVARDHAMAQFSRLTTYFKQASLPDPFPVIEFAVASMYGPPGIMLMDELATHVRPEKRASDGVPAAKRPVNPQESPYREVAEFIKQARACYAAGVRGQKIAEAILARLPAPAQPSGYGDVDLGLVKRAIDFATPIKGVLSGALGGIAANAMQSGDVAGATAKLNSPSVENELRRIRTQAMLTRFMTDRSPDNPISGYDPTQVASAYNDLSRLAPQLAGQPAVMQGLLARRLAGQFEPHEAKNTLDMENALRESRPPLVDLSLINDASSTV